MMKRLLPVLAITPLSAATADPARDAFVTTVIAKSCIDGPSYVRNLAARGEPVAATAIDWAKLKDEELDLKRHGQYTFDPAAEKLDFDKLASKIKLVKLKEGNYKSVLVTAKLAQDQLGKDYYLPGVEFQHWLATHPDRIPKEIAKRSGPQVYLIGSAIRGCDGSWTVPSLKAIFEAQAEAEGGPFRFGTDHALWQWDTAQIMVIPK
jgi:hypothetical protein